MMCKDEISDAFLAFAVVGLIQYPRKGYTLAPPSGPPGHTVFGGHWLQV